MAINLGGGGSASQINEIVFLNNTADTVTLADARVYLKGGVIETTTSTYPLAAVNYNYTGVNFSVASQEANPAGITWDGTYFWMVGRSNDTVYKYNSAGVYQSVSFSVAGQETAPTGITWDGTYFYVVGGGQAIAKYNSAGVHQSSTSVNAQTTTPTGITWDGTYFWVLGGADQTVYKYNSAGVYQSVSFSVADQTGTNPQGITWDGTYFWVLGAYGSNTFVYKYNSAGVYQGESFGVSAVDTGAADIVSSGTDLFYLGWTGDKVYKYGLVNGISSDNSFGGQNYVRVA